jgi:hypothetical protein
MKQWEGLLKGERLIPSDLLQWAYGDHEDGKVLNLKKLLDDPPVDLFNFERIKKKGIARQVSGAGERQKLFDVAAVFAVARLFDSPFGFAYAARLN